ncbi:hypothetical protein [Pseudotabrizicola formosa]|uniref:hypothetical protein n=1 Tax=Pseudotabrizicola formosa TaxID=2030009 RepID=UPI000CD0D95A|nr:hypothetical protein [Pseudotabrizicola formosa]
MRRVLILGLPLMLLACGPIPVPQAERECLQRARLAQQPRGEAAVGFDSEGGMRTRFEMDITSDFITGRDPSAVYDSCVYQKSGQAPSRPLYSFPEWKG